MTKITLYTSNFCGQASRVERFLAKHQIDVDIINIDEEPGAREKLIELNNGFASVPTLLFPDGSQLTEPSLNMLRQKLDIEEDDWMDTVRKRWAGDRKP